MNKFVSAMAGVVVLIAHHSLSYAADYSYFTLTQPSRSDYMWSGFYSNYGRYSSPYTSSYSDPYGVSGSLYGLNSTAARANRDLEHSSDRYYRNVDAHRQSVYDGIQRQYLVWSKPNTGKVFCSKILKTRTLGVIVRHIVSVEIMDLTIVKSI